MSPEKKSGDGGKEELQSSLRDVLSVKGSMSPELQKELEELLQLESQVTQEMEDVEQSTFSIEASEDKMELWLTLHPVEEGQTCAILDDILEVVMEENYQCELLVEEIEKARESDLEKSQRVLIGTGTPAINGCDGYFEFHVEEPTNNFISEDDHEQIDYRTHFRFVDVRKDQELLTVHPPSQSVPGRDVLGNILPAKEGLPVSAVGGRNIQYIRENGVMYATADGCFLRNKNTFQVDEVFVVNGDLDMSIGNIDTLSRVMVHGNVLPGFKIRSASDIHVMGNVEASDLLSENGWVRIEGGVLGKNASRIKAPKGFTCKFAQQALISSEGVIQIEDSVLFCTISCGDRLIIKGGKHAVVSGGNIRIRKSIEVSTIGAPSEPLTTLTMGFDFSYEDELNLLDQQKVDILNNIDALEEQVKMCESTILKMAKGDPEALGRKKELIHFKKESLLLKIQADEVGKKISDVEDKALCFDHAWIRASKSIHGNTLVKMSRRVLKIENEVKEALVELDPKNELIIINGEKV